MATTVTEDLSGFGRHVNVAIPAGETIEDSKVVYFNRQRGPMSVTAIPGGGGTMLVQFTTSSQAQILAGAAVWQDWPSGAVSATTCDVLMAPVTAIRATATTQPGTLEVVQ